MKFTKLFTAFSLACLLAACSSNTPASDSNTNHAQNQTSVNDEKTSDDTNTNNNSSNSSNSSNTNSNQNSGNAYAAGSEFENAFAMLVMTLFILNRNMMNIPLMPKIMQEEWISI